MNQVSNSWLNYRVGQNHIYTVYIRYFWQGNHQIYGHIRCIYTVLANPIKLLNAFAYTEDGATCCPIFGSYPPPSARYSSDASAISDHAWSYQADQQARSGMGAMWAHLQSHGPWRPPTIPEIDESKLWVCVCVFVTRLCRRHGWLILPCGVKMCHLSVHNLFQSLVDSCATQSTSMRRIVCVCVYECACVWVCVYEYVCMCMCVCVWTSNALKFTFFLATRAAWRTVINIFRLVVSGSDYIICINLKWCTSIKSLLC